MKLFSLPSVFLFQYMSARTKITKQNSREFHGFSEYVIIVRKILVIDDTIPKIRCLTYFFQVYITNDTIFHRYM